MSALTFGNLSELVQDQRSVFLSRSAGTLREVNFERALAHDRIVAITGVRRCGKSTLLRQLADGLDGEFHYFNFDDERALGFEVEHFDLLMQVFSRRGGYRTLLFDEIQNIPQWELFARRVHDEGHKLIITGSNARLLSQELGTRLTGRHISLPLYPFSFREFLAFRGIDPGDRTTAGKGRLQEALQDFVTDGGFPEFLRTPDPELLQRTYEDVLYRDIAARHGVRDVKALAELAHLLFTQVSARASYSKLKDAVGVASATTVRHFVGYLQLACLIYEARRFDFSLHRQYVTGRKIYVVDNGMRRAVAFTGGPDSGRLLENAVYLELRRRGYEVFFHHEKNECDFVCERNGTYQVLQVCWDLTPANHERELAGLQEAAGRLGLTEGTIVTQGQESLNRGTDPTGPSKEFGDINVSVVPAWRWLLKYNSD